MSKPFWNQADMAEPDPSKKVFLVPVTFMVIAEDQTDAEVRIRRGMKLISPYNLGILKAEIETPKERM